MSYSVDYHTAIGRQVEGVNTDKSNDNIIFEFVFKPWQIERARTGGNDLNDAITNHHCYFTTWFFVEIPGSKTSLLSLLCEILSTCIIFNLWKTSLFVDFCNKIIYFFSFVFSLFKHEAKWLIFRNNRNTKSFWSYMICTELTEDSLHSWLNGCRIFFKALI